MTTKHLEQLGKDFLIECARKSKSMAEMARLSGIRHLDHVETQLLVGDFIGLDLRDEINHNRDAEKAMAMNKLKNTIATCTNCGKTFRFGDRMCKNKSGNTFCSDRCAHQYASKFSDPTKISESMKRFNIPLVNKRKMEYEKDVHTCPICGKQIPYEKRRYVTCSLECGRKLRNQTISKRYRGSGRTGGYRERSSRGKCGYYHGVFCASTYELAFLIYCIDHGIEIQRNTRGYPYIWNGQTHMYYPDWIVNGDHIVETKNFITELVLEKAKAVTDMEITILDTNKMTPYFEYVATKYGKRFHGRWNNFYELYD